MHVFKVVSRVKVAGERRSPYRVLGLPLGADLHTLAQAIVTAFGFDFDHAFGFFDTPDPYRANVAYELFRDLEGLEDGPSAAPDLPDEADLALMLGMEALDKLALLRETADFLARRLEEDLLPRLPERLREPARLRLRDFTADLLDVEELEKAQEGDSLPLPRGLASCCGSRAAWRGCWGCSRRPARNWRPSTHPGARNTASRAFPSPSPSSGSRSGPSSSTTATTGPST